MDLYISKQCKHCAQLLTLLRDNPNLQPYFNIKPIENYPYPKELKVVPTLIKDNQLFTDNELNKYDITKLLFEEIETDRLDNLYSLENKKIFFKIDVERHELNVLEGALNILSNNQCYLQIDIFPHLQDEILSFLDNNQFKVLHRINNDFYLKNFF